MDRLAELHTLLCTPLGYNMRKRRLLRSASMRLILAALPPGAVATIVEEGVEFAEWWMNADLDDEGLDERERLIRAYDRRQLRNPILERIESVRTSEFHGTPTVRRQPEFLALQALPCLLYDDYDSRGWHAEQSFKSALTACDEQRPTVYQRQKGANVPHNGKRQLEIARDIFGDPSHPVTFFSDWRTDTARALARAMYEARDFSAMPILADALQDADCDNEAILSHCRDATLTHVRGCWVVDLVLGKS